MQQQVIFLKIREAVTSYLERAVAHIVVSLALFSDREIFEALVLCQRRGVRVEVAIFDNQANRQTSIAWERLSAFGGKIYWIPEHASGESGSCQQFIAIDSETVISGDFHRGRSVSSNQLDPMLIHSDVDFATQIRKNFERLVGENQNEFKVTGFHLSLLEDPVVENLRIQARLLEVRVLAMEVEVAEIHRQIHLFDTQQEKSLGDLIRRYLDVKRRYLHHLYRLNDHADNRQKADTAENMYREYQQAREAKMDDPLPVELSLEQQQELKLLYRKLAMQCHPDRVEDDQKVNAKAFFQQLQETYLNNDLVSLKNLKIRIDDGLGCSAPNTSLGEAVRIKKRLIVLQQTMARLCEQHAMLIQSAPWRELNAQSNWSAWFDQQAEQLQIEMQKYMSKLDQAQYEIKACTP